MDETYRKGKGNAGLDGIQFQVNLVIVFLLNALRKLAGWKISTENQDASKFDDIVMELSDGRAVLLQAKSKINRRITKEQLLSTNPKNIDFSLPKYFFSYYEVKSKFKPKAVVICTNADVDKKGLKSITTLDFESADSLLHYEGAQCPIITFTENILSDLRKNTIIYYHQNLQGKGIDKDIISEENLRDFLNIFKIVFNYPSGEKLKTVICRLQSLLTWSSLIKNVSYEELYKKVEDWFQQERGEYLTEARANAMFCEIKSDKYCTVLKDYNISFKYNDFNFEGSRRIFHIIARQECLLSILKTYNALRSFEKKTLYINPLCDTDVQRQSIDAFSFPKYIFLVLILPESLETAMHGILRLTLDKYQYKKVIIVSKALEINLEEDILEINGSVSFQDLAKDCQQRLIHQKNIYYQGTCITLKELLITEDYDKFVDSEILEKLVKYENVKVGSQLRPLDDHISTYYINRIFERKILGRKEEQWEKVSEEEIYEVSEKVVLIQDSAGAGKSTVLAHLTGKIKEENEHLWVVLIKLNDYTGILNEFKGKQKETITLKELLNSRTATRFTNTLEEQVFCQTEKVVLLVDGMDEISPDYTDLLLNLLTQCQKESNTAKLFITTRPHLVVQLEKILKVQSFKLQPFTDQCQINFLTNYWSHNLGISDQNRNRCAQYSVNLLRKTSSWTCAYNKQHLAAVPLQVTMLADIFQESSRIEGSSDWEGCKEYLSGSGDTPKLPERMDIGKIYRNFIETKRNVFMVKGNQRGNTAANLALNKQFEECLMYHKVLALRELLQEEECELFSNYQQIGESIEATLLQIGMVQKSEDKFYFCHRTFAEYFVAENILNEMQVQLQSKMKGLQDVFGKMLLKLKLQDQNRKTEFQKFFFARILLKPQFKVVRTFLNSLLHETIRCMPNDIFDAYKVLSYKLDLRVNGSLLHNLTKEGCTVILQLLFKCISFKIVKNKEAKAEDILRNYPNSGNTLKVLKFLVRQNGVNILDSVNKTPLSYAVDLEDLEMVKFLTDRGATISDSMLYESVEKDNLKLVTFLAGAVLENDCPSSKSPIIPYSLAYLGKTDQLKDLVSSGVNINIRAENGETLILGAFRRNHLDTIRYLVSQGAETNCRDKEGNTLLHLAGNRNSSIATVGFLLELGVDINSKNKYGNTALHCSVKNLDIVKLLVKSGATLNSMNRKGETVLWEAIRWVQLETVKFLVNEGCDLSIREAEGGTALHFAATRSRGFELLKCLLGNKEDVSVTSRYVNVIDKDSNTPLHLAAYVSVDTTRYMLELGADVNKTNNEGRTALHIAAIRGCLDTVQLLVQHTDINIQDKDDKTALHLAVSRGQLETVVCLVKNFANVNARDKEGQTALHIAAYTNRPDILKFLVENFADVNSKDRDCQTPVYLAAARSLLDTVVYLVEHNADVHIVEKENNTPLHVAACKGRLDTVKYLIKFYQDIDARDKIGRTPLHLAALGGWTNIVRYFIENGADVNASDGGGCSALHLAAAGVESDTVEYLLRYTADVNIKNGKGCTPLHLAALKGRSLTVGYLIGNSASVNSRDSDGRTPLHLAAVRGKLDTVKVLVRLSSDVTSRDHRGHTPLQLTILNKNFRTIDYLIDHSADVNAKAEDDRTALHLAAFTGLLYAVKHLLRFSADVSCRDSQGRTALQLAALGGRLRTVKYFVKRSVDVNTRDSDGCTALHLAAFGGSVEVVKYLVDFLDINCKDDKGHTALHLAASEGHLNTVKYLLECSGDVNSRDTQGFTALHSAAVRGRCRVVKYLVDNSAEVNARDNLNQTALQLVVSINLDETELESCYSYISNFLLDRGADVDIEDSNGNRVSFSAEKNYERHLLSHLKSKQS